MVAIDQNEPLEQQKKLEKRETRVLKTSAKETADEENRLQYKIFTTSCSK